MAALGIAREAEHFHSQQRLDMSKHVARMVDGGLLPRSALAALEGANPNAVVHSSGIPTVIRSRPQGEYVYNHVKSLFPMPKPSMASKLTLGTGQVSMGRARWTADGASIFSVADGKQLAQTPYQAPTPYERLRAAKVAAAEMETPLVRGMRLLPVFSPGRAFFWGSVLAVWGTAASVLSLKQSLGIQRPEDTNQVLAAMFAPVTDSLRRAGERVRGALAASALVLPSAGPDAEPSETVKRMRAMFH